MDKNTLAIFLPHDETNKYQQLMMEDARKAARKAGFEVDAFFSGGQVVTQVRQIYNCIRGEAFDRTLAVIAMPVTDNSLNRVASDAVRAGLGWICLHRQMDCLEELRKQYPSLPISAIGPDQLEIGRIQGRQFRLLLPGGGRVLYVQGNATTSSARSRSQGVTDSIAGSRVEIDLLDGNWSAEDAERTVGGWLKMVMSGKARLDLIGCQNDDMAVGASAALKSVAAYLRKPELENVPVTGCNGLPSFGQRLVNEGKMAATIIMPSSAAAGVDLIAAARQGKPVPPSVLLSATSYPDEAALERVARTRR